MLLTAKIILAVFGTICVPHLNTVACRYINDGQVWYFYQGRDTTHFPSQDLLNWVGYVAICDGSLEKIKGVYPI
jgi:hypothetical protein